MVALTLGVVAESATAAEPDPTYQMPTVGECHDYSYDTSLLKEEPSPAVACSSKHRAQVAAVAMIPADMDWSDGNQVFEVIVEPCRKATYELTGLGPRAIILSTFVRSYFRPTAEQRAAGARWVRCDLAAIAKAGAALQTLPAKNPFIKDSIPNRYRRCFSAQSILVSCDRQHEWRAAASYRNAGAWPGRARLKQIAIRRCNALTSTRYYTYGIPTKASWKAGFRFTVCYDTL